jgi:carbamoyl-phosphate synthase large subunit
MKTKGLVNIQYLIYQNELYVIEVNPRASRTIPYISKVTGIPMTEIATKVMMGKTVKELGYKTGLCKTPPYFTVKVPVFSFEKLLDVNAYLGPEMKSTGEVLGIGKTLNEALFKGLKAAGMKLEENITSSEKSVFISVEEHDYLEIVSLAKKFDDLGMKIYATPDTANAIKVLGIDVETTAPMEDMDSILSLIDSEKINYIVYTGAAYDDTIKQYIFHYCIFQ